jgi:cytochrome c oxidase subunit 2
MRYFALDAAGPAATYIAANWWLLFWVCLVIYIAVIAALLIPLRARVRQPQLASVVESNPEPARERRIHNMIAVCVGISALILIVFLAASVITGRAIASLSGSEVVNIQITGYRWWWRVEYLDQLNPSRQATTANEIHIPVGQPVKLILKSYDVIHSLWIPELHGKRDLIPGHPNVITVQAERAGIYYGQCAEFCGLQHAHMRLVVVAEEPEKFTTWLDAQRQPANPPKDELAQRGQQVFLSQPCAFCHNISGTEASGTLAPDLTHMASRLTLAAGSVPNTRGNLAGWIVDSQHVKPGNMMPSISLSSDDLQALLAYLGGLS